MNGLITFFIDGNPVFNNGPRSLSRNRSDCIILVDWVFDSSASDDYLFEKALWRLETCLSVNNDLCGKLVSSLELPIIFDENLKTTSFSLFMADFNLLSCELIVLHLNYCIESFYVIKN